MGHWQTQPGNTQLCRVFNTGRGWGDQGDYEHCHTYSPWLTSCRRGYRGQGTCNPQHKICRRDPGPAQFSQFFSAKLKQKHRVSFLYSAWRENHTARELLLCCWMVSYRLARQERLTGPVERPTICFPDIVKGLEFRSLRENWEQIFIRKFRRFIKREGGFCGCKKIVRYKHFLPVKVFLVWIIWSFHVRRNRLHFLFFL